MVLLAIFCKSCKKVKIIQFLQKFQEKKVNLYQKILKLSIDSEIIQYFYYILDVTNQNRYIKPFF